MADHETMDLLNLLRKGLDGAEPDLLRDMVQVMAEGLMGAEANHLCGAEYRERADDRMVSCKGAPSDSASAKTMVSHSRPLATSRALPRGLSTPAIVCGRPIPRDSRVPAKRSVAEPPGRLEAVSFEGRTR